MPVFQPLTASVILKAYRCAVDCDAPLLYESGMDAICGLVAAVIAPEDLRLKRILARDGITEQEARRRMAVQPDEAFYRAKGARLLVNDGDLAALRRQADALLACINHRT